MQSRGKGSSLEVMNNLHLGGLYLPISGLLLVGCSAGPMSTSTTQFVASTRPSMTAGQIVDRVKTLQKPANKSIYEQARGTALADMFTNAVNNAPTDPIILGGHTFDNMHDYLAAHMDYLQEISDNYGTIGNYADAMGIASIDDATVERMQITFDLMDKVINQNISLATNSPTTSAAAGSAAAMIRNQINTPQMNGLALGTKLGCAGSLIGAGAAAVGAGIACAATFGGACVPAGVGAVGAGLGAASACDGVLYNNQPDPSTQPQAGGGNTITTTYGGDQTTKTTTDANGNTISSQTTTGNPWQGGDTQQQPTCSGNASMTVHQQGQADQNIPCG